MRLRAHINKVLSIIIWTRIRRNSDEKSIRVRPISVPRFKKCLIVTIDAYTQDKIHKYLERANQTLATGKLVLAHEDYITAVNLPNHLKANENLAINTCCLALAEELHGNLLAIWLFGSKARGDFNRDSDIDLLIIVKTKDNSTRWRIRELAANYSLAYDVLFNTHILDSHHWEIISNHKDTLWREIQRDGILLVENVLVH